MKLKQVQTWQWALLALILFFGADWAIRRPDAHARALNEVLEASASAALKAYPYPFRVFRVEEGRAVMGTPRNFDVPALRVLGVLYPQINVKDPHDPAFIEAQQTLAARQSEAGAIVAAQPGIRGIKWELDTTWLAAHGIDIPPR